MSDPKKEVAEIKKGIDQAQEAVYTGIVGLFTSAQEVLKLLKDQKQLTRQQLSDLTTGLDHLNDSYNRLNEDTKQIDKEVSKLPMLTGKVPPKMNVANLQKQVDKLNADASSYYSELEKLRQSIKKGLPTQERAPSPKPGK